MLQEVLNLYYLTVLIAVFLMVLDSVVNKEESEDPFEAMDKMNELLDDIHSEKARRLIENFIGAVMDNKMVGYAALFLVCAVPILNLFVIISLMRGLIGKKDKGE